MSFKMKMILSFLIFNIFFSCKDQKSQEDIEKQKRDSIVNRLNLKSNESFDTAILLIKDSGFRVNIDSVKNEFKNIKRDSAELGLKYAENLKEYGFDLQFKKIDKEAKVNESTNQTSSKLTFDPTKISTYRIEDSEIDRFKPMMKKLSEYKTKELRDLPDYIRLTLSIVVPYDISRESLENTMKYIVTEKSRNDKDIDEIMIFAYDDKNDIGYGYTFGKLLWAPKGEIGNATPEIAKSNLRSNYKLAMNIKDKVGEIKKSDLPTKRELEIYNELVSEKYWDMQDEDYFPIIMKKFDIRTEEELKNIFLKVGAYKL